MSLTQAPRSNLAGENPALFQAATRPNRSHSKRDGADGSLVSSAPVPTDFRALSDGSLIELVSGQDARQTQAEFSDLE